MALEDPFAVVLETPTGQLTSGELNERSDSLTHQLLGAAGVGARIAVQVAGTETLLVSALAVLRAGLVTVPIDPTAPPEWRDAILTDCQAALLLTDLTPTAGDAVLPACPVLVPGAGVPTRADPMDHPLSDLAAIIYTSGSTGAPKGVVIPNGMDGLDRRLKEVRAGSRFGFTGQGSVAQAHRILLKALEVGCPIVAFEVRGSNEETLGEWLVRTRVESFMTVPTVCRHVLKTMPPGLVLPDLRCLVMYGEAAVGEDVTQCLDLMPPDGKVVVSFGTTESGSIGLAVFAGTARPGPGRIAIRRMEADVEVIITDEHGLPVADGEVGEMVVVKEQPLLGYWNRPDLSATVFEHQADGTVRVRTNDRARRHPDGTIELLGRIDHVVKVAGNRVELGAIEAALLSQAGVADAVVAPYADHAGATRLTAAVVLAKDIQLSQRGLRMELARRLPPFMVPDEVAVLVELPRLGSGKVDRVTLAASRDRRVTEAPVNASDLDPADVVTKTLFSIFRDVLERSDLGMHDDFFEQGGDSLRAVELFYEIERQLGFQFAPTVLLQASTVVDLSHLLQTRRGLTSSVVPIQLGHPMRIPLFVVDAGTDGFAVRKLAKLLGSEQTVYELWASADQSTFEEVAAQCAAALTEVCPEGPYALYGFSLSGVMAFEMALQLNAAGHPPNLLVLGDSRAPGSSKAQLKIYGMWQRTVRDPRPLAILRRVAGRARRLGGTEVQYGQEEILRTQFRDEWKSHLQLVKNYRPSGPLICPVVLHRSSPYVGRRGWSRHVVGRVMVRDTAGEHLDQLDLYQPDVAAALSADLAAHGS